MRQVNLPQQGQWAILQLHVLLCVQYLLQQTLCNTVCNSICSYKCNSVCISMCSNECYSVRSRCVCNSKLSSRVCSNSACNNSGFSCMRRSPAAVVLYSCCQVKASQQQAAEGWEGEGERSQPNVASGIVSSACGLTFVPSKHA